MMALTALALPSTTMAYSLVENASAEVSLAASVSADTFGIDELTNLTSTNFSGFSDNGSVGSCSPLGVLAGFDLTEYDYDGRTETFIPIGWREALKIVAYVIVFLVSIIGNMLVILVVYYNDHMRTSTNQYLVNLAFADLLVTMGSMWVHMIRHLSFPNYILPAIFCKFDAFIQTTSLLGSVFTLTVISIGRFVAVMFPFLARTSPDRAHRVIAFVWIASASIASPILVYRDIYSVKWKDFTTWHCDEFWPSRVYYDPELKSCITAYSGKMVYYTILTVAFYFLPIGTMLVNYSMVVWKLWMTQLPGEHNDPARYASTRSKKRVVKMISAVLLVFAVCWTPLQCIILYTSFSKESDKAFPKWFEVAEFVAYFVAYSNSALNPIIYCGFNANFRQGLMALLTCGQSSFGRMYRCRKYSMEKTHSQKHLRHRECRLYKAPMFPCLAFTGNWRNNTARTHETTVGNSGHELAVVVDLNSTGRNNMLHRGPNQSARISITSSCTELRQNNVSDLKADLGCKRCQSEGNNIESHLCHGTAPSTIYNNHALHHDLHHNHNRHPNHMGDHGQGQNGRRLPLMISCDSNHSVDGIECACCRREQPQKSAYYE